MRVERRLTDRFRVRSLATAETQMAELERRYGDELPPGHAPLIVTKEKIAALKDQLATQ